MGAVEAGGTPMWHEPGAGARYFVVFFERAYKTCILKERRI
jgi:hypothetical protein